MVTLCASSAVGTTTRVSPAAEGRQCQIDVRRAAQLHPEEAAQAAQVLPSLRGGGAHRPTVAWLLCADCARWQQGPSASVHAAFTAASLHGPAFLCPERARAARDRTLSFLTQEAYGKMLSKYVHEAYESQGPTVTVVDGLVSHDVRTEVRSTRATVPKWK